MLKHERMYCRNSEVVFSEQVLRGSKYIHLSHPLHQLLFSLWLLSLNILSFRHHKLWSQIPPAFPPLSLCSIQSIILSIQPSKSLPTPANAYLSPVSLSSFFSVNQHTCCLTHSCQNHPCDNTDLFPANLCHGSPAPTGSSQNFFAWNTGSCLSLEFVFRYKCVSQVVFFLILEDLLL